METVADLDNAFRLYVDKADSQGSADFLSGERQRFLNDAQLRLARELAMDKNGNQDAVDLRLSLSTRAALPVVSGPDGADAVDLPTDYLAYGSNRAVLKPPYEAYRVFVRLISEDEINPLLDDDFNRPTVGDPVGCFLHGQLRLYPSGTLAQLVLSYYRRPALLDLSTPGQVPDLAPAVLPTLVQYAVQLALESVADPRFRSQGLISKLTDVQ